MTTVDRILAVDYGVKRIGLALSDALGITAQEFDTINVLKKDEHFLRIKEIVEKEKVQMEAAGVLAAEPEGQVASRQEGLSHWSSIET